jgi:hypothetical protein
MSKKPTKGGSTERLRDLRSGWLSDFDLEKKNSIANQLTALTWDMTCFEVFRETVSLSPDVPDGGKKLNGTIFNFLTRCFYKSFMSDVRKLIDKTKGTVSLVRLIDDISKNSSLFTRETIMKAEGIAYDYKSLVAKETELMVNADHVHHGPITKTLQPGQLAGTYR